MSYLFENQNPAVMANGFNTAKDCTFSGTVTFSGTTNLSAVSLTDLTTTGNTALGNAVSDTLAITGATTITSTSASALTVGRLGATTPVLKINAATSTVATGIEITGAASSGGVAVAAIGGTNESLTIDAKGTGTVTINGTATGIVVLPAGTTIGGSTVSALGVITSSSATALAVGLAGATNSAFVVDSSTGSQAAGLKVTGAVAAGTVAAAVISSGADASLTINAKGTGTIGIGSVSTGAVTITPATTVTGLITATGGLTSVADIVVESGTAVPATAGAVAAGAPVTLYSTGLVVEATSDVPTHSRPKGSLCINTGGTTTNNRLYINTDGAGTWTALTTAA